VRRAPEFILHKAVADFLRVALPDDVMWLHIPNGGSRTKAEAGKLKAMGVKPGAPDFLLLAEGAHYAIELKAKNGRLSDAQDQWAGEFTSIGGEYVECRSLEAVEAALRSWGFPLRATLNPGGGWRRAA